MKTQTIGVEIEMTGISRDDAAEAVARYFGTTANYVSGEYDKYTVKDNTGREWSLMRDTSIKSQKKNREGRVIIAHGDSNQVELVTPILKYDDIRTLQSLARIMSEAGAFVNDTCGLHVHIGAGDFTAKQLTNLLNYVASRETIFYSAFNVYEERVEFCGPTDKYIIKAVNEKQPATLEQFKKIWYYGDVRNAEVRYHGSRYTVCNLHSFFNKGTIEFRIFNSTLDGAEIEAYVQFCLALTNFAKGVNKAIYRKCFSESKRAMSTILYRIGLGGEEFKTCRYHLTKNLKDENVASEVIA